MHGHADVRGHRLHQLGTREAAAARVHRVEQHVFGIVDITERHVESAARHARIARIFFVLAFLEHTHPQSQFGQSHRRNRSGNARAHDHRVETITLTHGISPLA